MVKAKPVKADESGRDFATGKFLPGNQAGAAGRPRGLDFRRIVEEHAAKNGVDLPTAMWQVFEAMHKRAIVGDVQAAKLIVDKLCTADPIDVHVTGDAPGPTPPIDMRAWAAKLAALAKDDASG
jgi:hypothetical protein